MPEDPLAPPPKPLTTPPTRRRRRGPWAALLVIAVLITGVNAVVLRPDQPSALAARFAPEDGSAAYQQTATTQGGSTVKDTTAMESGRFIGLSGILSVDATLSARVLSAIDPDSYESVRLWRATSTSAEPPPNESDHQTTALYRVDGAIELLALTSSTEGAVYVPALTVLPADVAAGSRWHASGSAGEEVDYAADFTAETTPTPECLLTRGTIGYTNRNSGRLERTRKVDETWCPGRGVIESRQSTGDESSVMTTIVKPGLRAPSTRDVVETTIPEASWSDRPIDTQSDNPQFGREVMNGSSATTPSPVRTASGLIVRPGSSPADLIAFRIDPDGPVAVPVWRGHPGGAILSLSGFGDVVVVTTSDRRMVAYDSRGVRRWRKSFDDLAPTAPVRSASDQIVAVDLAGTVRSMMIDTGRVVWERNLRVDVNRGPAVGEDAVVIMDRGGTTRALELGTGADRWTVDVEAKDAVISGDTVIALQDQTVIGLSAVDGQRRWAKPILGTYTQMIAVGDAVAVATKQQTLIVGRSGRVRARRIEGFGLTSTAGRLIIWGQSSAQLVDASGADLGQWEIPALTNVTDARPALAHPSGLLLFDSLWPFRRWSP